MIPREAMSSSDREGRESAGDIEMAFGPSSASLPTSTSPGVARLHIRSAIAVAGGGALVAGMFSDPEKRVVSITLGGPGGTDLASIALKPGSRGSQEAFLANYAFIGLIRAEIDSVGLPLAARLTNGETVTGWAPLTKDLEPFIEFVNSSDVEDVINWVAALHLRAQATTSSLTSPQIAAILDCVWQRLDSARNDTAVTRGLNAHIDAAERIEGEGIVLKGWVAHNASDPLASCAAVSFAGLRADVALPLPATLRPDVVAAMTGMVAGLQEDCGFVAYAPARAIGAADSRWFFEVRLQGGRVLRTPFRLPAARSERAAIEGIIEWAEDSAIDLNDLFMRALDAPVGLLWRRALGRRHEPKALTFGSLPQPTQVSIIVPLFGRLDLMRHQLAHFSNDTDFIGERAVIDLIYVLDDFGAGLDFQRKARQAADAYGVPFRVIDLGGNYGYSTANNVGAAAACGEILILLNSDVMPKRPGWATELARTLKATPSCGVLGCRLLYEDDSIQHAGMEFRDADMLPGAFVNYHPAKGLSVDFDPHRTLEPVRCVTGACLTIPRALYRSVGGLSEDYVIGDFEDSDLCLKVRTQGLDVYYTPAVELYHFERQSMRLIGQGRAEWRQKLTLFNMWRHATNWRHLIEPEIVR